MTDSDLAAQLALLQDILGQQVSLCDAGKGAEEAHDTTAATAAASEPRWETLQTKSGWPETTTGEAGTRDAPGKQEAAHFAPIPEPSRHPDVDYSTLVVGDTVGDDVAFCTWKMLVDYPTTFIGKANKPRARPFFDIVLQENSWDFFYLHDPRRPELPARLLVPTAQFERFLGKINEELKTALVIPPGVNSAKFRLKFGGEGVPKPRYLTHSNNEHDLPRASLPAMSDADIQGFARASKTEQQAFISTFERMVTTAGNPDKKRKAQERAAQRASKRQAMMEQAQTFLGLKGVSDGPGVVFVGVDVEALEVSPHPVSEVGIAVLDTNDLETVQPGPAGSEWWQFVKAHHLRVMEYSGTINHRFVEGCPDAFDFGESSFPAQKELKRAIMSILEPYTSAKRKLVLVAHDAKQDIDYLSQIGLEVHDLPGIADEIDTKELHQAWCGCDSGRGLWTVLSDLGIRSANLHNAGNDAVFAIRGMMGLAVEQVRKEEAKERGEAYVPALWAEQAEEAEK